MGGFQQSILDSLQSAGFQNMAFSQLNQLTPEQIASTFAQQYNLDQEDLPSTMFQPIKQNLLQATNWGTYSPAVEAEGQTKLQGLYKGLGGTGATQAAGGFAGSGGFGKYQGGIKDVYGKSMSDVIGQSRGQQQQAGNLISDLIGGWHETAQRIKGY